MFSVSVMGFSGMPDIVVLSENFQTLHCGSKIQDGRHLANVKQ